MYEMDKATMCYELSKLLESEVKKKSKNERDRRFIRTEIMSAIPKMIQEGKFEASINTGLQIAKERKIADIANLRSEILAKQQIIKKMISEESTTEEISDEEDVRSIEILKIARTEHCKTIEILEKKLESISSTDHYHVSEDGEGHYYIRCHCGKRIRAVAQVRGKKQTKNWSIQPFKRHLKRHLGRD